MPFATNLVRLGVVVLARIAELFRVVRLGLACAEGIGDGQHDAVGLLEIPLLPCWFSAEFVLAVLLAFVPRNFSIDTIVSAQSSCHGLWRLSRFDLNGSFKVRGVLLRQADDRELFSAQLKAETIGMSSAIENLRRN
jgi:hypothetical protein